jgi:peptidoglycan glycosyltransferase
MTWRGRLTLLVPVLLVALGVVVSRLEVQLPEFDWLVPPSELRLGIVSTASQALVAPEGLAERLPVSKAAFEEALETVDWLPSDPPPGTRLWESVPAPADSGLLAPLRLEYTLDVELTRRVFAVLEESRVGLGHVLVLDPASGDVLAYVSTDPVRFPPTRHYPAASLIKVVTAAAALDVAPETSRQSCRFVGSPYQLTRARVDPPRGGTEISLGKALATSNNQCFAQLAVHTIGASGMLDVIRRFGFLEAAGPAHGAGQAEDPGEDSFALGQLGCGLSGCRITPLHAARLASTLDDGLLVEPRWLTRVVDGAGRDLEVAAPAESRRVLTPELARQVREMLVETTRRGTARRAFSARGRPLLGSVQVAGKTGSLNGRDPDGRYEWFAGVAPAENPRVAVATLVVQGELWWRTSSQVAAQVFEQLFCEHGDCRADYVDRWFPVKADAAVAAERPEIKDPS